MEYVKPLMDLIKSHTLSKEILDGIYDIIVNCIKKQYMEASDRYLELAIGNAPWPMGVTMVGIHERSGRSKIFSSQIARI